MIRNDLDRKISETEKELKRLKQLKSLGNEPYHEEVIQYLQIFNPVKISGGLENPYIEFEHKIEFQAAGSIREFCRETGLVPVAWWNDGDFTTVSFDRVFSPRRMK